MKKTLQNPKLAEKQKQQNMCVLNSNREQNGRVSSNGSLNTEQIGNEDYQNRNRRSAMVE